MHSRLRTLYDENSLSHVPPSCLLATPGFRTILFAFPKEAELGLLVQEDNPSTQEATAGGPALQGQPQLQ